MSKQYYNSKGKLAGSLTFDIYIKKVNSNKHKMRIFGGAYGIDKIIVDELKTVGCKGIKVMEVDTKNILFANFDDFMRYGIERNFDGMQVFLPIKYWGIDGEKPEHEQSYQVRKVEEKKLLDSQPNLFK